MNFSPDKKNIGRIGKILKTAALGVVLAVSNPLDVRGQDVASSTVTLEFQQEKDSMFTKTYGLLVADCRKYFDQGKDENITFKDSNTVKELQTLIAKPYAQEVFDKIFEASAKGESQEESMATLGLMYNIPLFKDQPYAEEVIGKLLDSYIITFHQIDQFADQPYAYKLLGEKIEGNLWNGSLVDLLNSKKELKQFLLKSESPAIQKIVTLANFFLEHKELFDSTAGENTMRSHNGRMDVFAGIQSLFEEIVRENMSVEEALRISSDTQSDIYLDYLLKIKRKPDHLNPWGVERSIRGRTLRSVRQINNLHEQPDEVRFQSVEHYDADMLYYIMAYSPEEVFTSSFNGLFNRLLQKMESEHKTGNQLLQESGYDEFRIFIKECAGFNRLNEFLQTMSEANQQQLLEKFVKGIDKERDKLAQAVTVADVFNLLNDPKVLQVFQNSLKEEYERSVTENSKDGKAMYGLLAGMFGEKASIDNDWLKEMSTKYQLESISAVNIEQLFNQEGVNVQQYFFYDDTDGKSSFESFLFQYEHKKDWKVEKRDTYVHITSIGTGNKIEIYANFPTAEREGPQDIKMVMHERDIQSSVIVHRGHSYHAQKTIDRITPNAKIVSMGSCGGYNNLSKILEKASGAHIISTKGTGVRAVNDPLLKMLNNEILAGKDIDWSVFWQRMQTKLGDNDDFKNYVAPHRNLGVLFLKAYNKILSSEQK